MLDYADTHAAPPPRGAKLFFLAVYGSTWLFQLPAMLADGGVLPGPAERFMPLVVLGFFGPAIIAILLSALEGKHAVRALFKPLSIWRVNIGWYALALGLPCAIFLVVRTLAMPFGGPELGGWFYPPAQPQQIAALLLIPFTEQIPWRGYVYPKLELAHGPQRASLITGFAWGLFHVQKHAFIDPNASPAIALLTLAFMAAGTVVFSWFYLRSGGSMLLVVVAHMGVYLNNPSTALPNPMPLALHTLGYGLIALTLLRVDRQAWQSRPRVDANVPASS